MTAPWRTAFIALCVLVFVLAVIVLGLLRRVSAALERAEQDYDTGGPVLGLRPGARIAAFEVTTATGQRMRLPAEAPDDVFVVLLLELDCEACVNLLDEMGRHPWPPDAGPLLLVLPEVDRERASTLGLDGVQLLYQSDLTASNAFDTNVSPIAYAVSAEGTILDRLIPSDVQSLRVLAADASPDRPRHPHPTVHSHHREEHAHARP